MQTMINDGRKLPGGQRTNVVGIAKAMAMVAAASAPAPLLAERAAAAKAALDSPQGRLAQAVFALPHITIDFEVLGKRNARQLVAQLLLCSPAPLVEAILRLVQDVSRERSSIGGVAQAEVLRRIRTAVLEHALPCLRRTDWKGKKKPEHVGLVYAILLTMSAADINRERIRIFVKGEAVSQMFRVQLGQGYKIMLAQVRFSSEEENTPSL